MLTRETMEQQQTWFYVVALFVGAVIGLSNPVWGNVLHYTVSPVLAVLLCSMFVQIPFLQLKESWSNLRFMGSLLVANFIVVPVVVWLLTLVFPQSPGVLIGVYLVLLTPCIDYVIVFTQLGRGDEKLMLAATPLLFVIQMDPVAVLFMAIDGYRGGTDHAGRAVCRGFSVPDRNSTAARCCYTSFLQR